jgi:hypothetical protein
VERNRFCYFWLILSEFSLLPLTLFKNRYKILKLAKYINLMLILKKEVRVMGRALVFKNFWEVCPFAQADQESSSEVSLTDSMVLQNAVGAFERLDQLFEACGGRRNVSWLVHSIEHVQTKRRKRNKFCIAGHLGLNISDHLTVRDLCIFVWRLEKHQRGIVADIINGKVKVQVDDIATRKFGPMLGWFRRVSHPRDKKQRQIRLDFAKQGAF